MSFRFHRDAYMVFEKLIRYANLAVGLIPFPVEHSAFVEVLDRTVTPCKAIHNPTSAIQNGIKPSATECEARLRGLERSMYSETI